MKKMFGLCLWLLFCSIGMAQETPTVPPEPATPPQAVTQTTRTAKFQGLWQQRSGHSLLLDYNYEYLLDLEEYRVGVGEYQWPLRFDLSYQYDIPWRPKRVSLFVEAGLGYELQRHRWPKDEWMHAWDWVAEEQYLYVKRQSVQQRLIFHFGGGFRVHCTDWLYFSFSGGFQAAYEECGNYEIYRDSKERRLRNKGQGALFGGQSAMRLVGQIKRFSIQLGYRANHWIVSEVEREMRYGTEMYLFSHTDWFLTLGVGYHF